MEGFRRRGTDRRVERRPKSRLFQRDHWPPSLYAVEPTRRQTVAEQTISAHQPAAISDDALRTASSKVQMDAAPTVRTAQRPTARNLRQPAGSGARCVVSCAPSPTDLEQVIHGPRVLRTSATRSTAGAAGRGHRAPRLPRKPCAFMKRGRSMNGKQLQRVVPRCCSISMPEEEAAHHPARHPAGHVAGQPSTTFHHHWPPARAGPWPPCARGAAGRGFERLLRRPRRGPPISTEPRPAQRCPPLMCGADNNYLALTWRQIEHHPQGEPKRSDLRACRSRQKPPKAFGKLVARAISTGPGPLRGGRAIPLSSAAGPPSVGQFACPGPGVRFPRRVGGASSRAWCCANGNSLVVDVDDECPPRQALPQGPSPACAFIYRSRKGTPSSKWLTRDHRAPAASDPQERGQAQHRHEPRGAGRPSGMVQLRLSRCAGSTRAANLVCEFTQGRGMGAD